jgi:thiamine-monophosphate kinase
VPSRSGAKAGDLVYITGPVGAAMLGLEAYRAGSGDSLAYRRPRALMAEGQALAPLVSAMMDISDGLLLDSVRLANASGVTLAIDRGVVPIATPEDRRNEALRWGDDYQLLFTAPPGTALPVPAAMIGSVLDRSEAPLLLDGAPPEGKLGYEHR